MSAIGILGGMGPQASARLYDLLVEDTKAFTPDAVDADYPEIVLLNVPVPNFISKQDKLVEAREMLVERTKLLERAGCTVNGIACNTAHILLPELQAVTKVPFLSVPKLVAENLQFRGFKKAGLLATPTTLKSRLYDDALPGTIELVRPSLSIARQVEGLIYKQLVGSLTLSDRQNFVGIVESFRRTESLDVVILGCTELPLVYGSGRQETVIDTLQLLADALLNNYYKKV